MQHVFDQLYSRSRNGNNFYKLVELMKKEENIQLAYRNIKRNMGSNTPGVDGKTIKDIKELTIQEVTTTIQQMFNWYQPKAVRRVYIPKANGNKRPLGIPTIWDRLFQQCILQVLEPICEAKFHPRSYGFRPNRNAHHAFARVNSLVNNRGDGYHYCVDLDIKGFFDNVNHGKLLKQIWTLGIRDKKLISIISALIKTEIVGEGKPQKGTPQGGILSPLLANIVLNELDWWVSNQWETFTFTRRNYTTQRSRLSALRNSNSTLKRCYLIRYADDAKILCRDYPSALKIYHATKDFLEKRLKLDISPEKSQIVNLRKRSSEFLGFTIKVKSKRKGFVAHSRMSPKARMQAHTKLKKAIKTISKKQSTESVWHYNTVVMGIHNYYEVATHINIDLDHISQHLTKTLYNRLRRDWKRAKKSDMTDGLKKRYWRYNPKWYKAHDMVIIPIYAWRHRYAINFSQEICSYTPTGREKLHDNLKAVNKEVLRHVQRHYENYRSVEYNDNRLSKFVAQYGKCAISGRELGLFDWECHHKIPLHSQGTDAFDNLIIILKEFHIAIHHKTKEKLEHLFEEYQLSESKVRLCNKLYKLAHN